MTSDIKDGEGSLDFFYETPTYCPNIRVNYGHWKEQAKKKLTSTYVHQTTGQKMTSSRPTNNKNSGPENPSRDFWFGNLDINSFFGSVPLIVV